MRRSRSSASSIRAVWGRRCASAELRRRMSPCWRFIWIGIERRSAPLLADFIEAGLFQIVEIHHDVKLHVRLKREEKRFGQGRHFGWLGNIDNRYAPALAVKIAEI